MEGFSIKGSLGEGIWLGHWLEIVCIVVCTALGTNCEINLLTQNSSSAASAFATDVISRSHMGAGRLNWA